MAYTAGYMTQLQLTEFIQLNTFYKKCQIDFIQYLSILNSTLQPISIAKNKQFKAFSFIPYQFNNPFQISDNFNSEYRRLLNLDLQGNPNPLGDDLISQIARQFTDLCIKISYTREAVKQELQTYSIIGTNKIIQNSVRDFFLKNFSERKNWRYTANSTLKLQQNSDLSGQFISLEKLNNTLQLQGYNSQFFNVSMVQYFDPTNYLNIYAQLPETIIDYIQTSAIVPSTKVLTENYISTTVIGGDGLLSTIYDDFGFIAPQSGLIINDNNFTTANVGTQNIQIPIWNSNAISSVIIKPGTVVSSIITPGNIIQTTGIQYTQIPVYAPCTVLFSQTWNSQFWNKTNVNQLTYNQLSAQIKYYSTYFTQMNKLTTNQAKRQYYINQVYPKFKTIWQTFATSGFTNDKYYLGRPPGNNITKNIGNSIFPTIAPLQQLHNLIPANEIQTNTLFLSKLFYNQTKYYLHLMTKQILNMHYYNKQTLNYGIPQQGWKRSYIEYKGYNTMYQESKNILPTDITPNKNIDVDGPWVYSTLQKFISLYIKENNQISYTKLLDFVKSEYFVIDENIQMNIVNKLFAFQHEIYNKNQYNIHDFYLDSFQNQYTLFKHYQHNNYQDTGQIWIRMKNYQLSVPLMKLTYIRFNGSVYTFDEYDTMYCRQQISYVNMFKQLVNNAIQFGVINNIIWILGRTTWTDLNGTLTQNLRGTIDTSDSDKEIYGSGKNYSYLKLVSAEFSKNDTLNTLQININSIKFYTTDSKTTVLNDINQFIGVYVDNKLKNINFVLYNKNLHISNILKNNVTIASDTIEYLKNSTMPLTIHSYSLINSTSSEKIFYINNTQFPLINMCQEKFIVDFYKFKTSLSETYKINDFIDNSISGMVYDNSYGQREIFGKIINVQDNIIITGNIKTQISGTIKTNETYGQISANIQNDLDIISLSSDIKLQNIYWYDSTLNGVNLANSGTVSGVIKLDNFDMSILSEGIMLQNPNIWRLTNDSSNVNIAYECINKNISDFNIYKNILTTQSRTYYVGILRYICELNTKTIISNEIFTNGFASIYAEYDAEPIYIISPNNQLDLQILQTKYPKCALTQDNKLIVETLATTLGGEKTNFTSISPDNVLSILRDTISIFRQGVISAELTSNINYILNDNYVGRYYFKDTTFNVYYQDIDTFVNGVFENTLYSYNNVSGNIEVSALLTGNSTIIDYNDVAYNIISSYMSGTLYDNQNNDIGTVFTNISGFIPADKGAINKLKDVLMSDAQIEYRENISSYISAGIMQINQALTTEPEINSGLTIFDNGWGFNFIKYYNKYLNDLQDLKSLELYNNSLSAISVINNFSPILTNCFTDELKIIFNFGQHLLDDYITGSQSFDLDIKVYIDDQTQRTKPVGWRCGYKTTTYLNWITGDSTLDGPQIVLVDVNKYITNNLYKRSYITTNNWLYNQKQQQQNLPYLNIIINVCWYDASKLRSNNVNININWRGYNFVLPVSHILENVNCCNNPVFKVSINLINNTIQCIPIYFTPVLIYSKPKIVKDKNGIQKEVYDPYSISIGYIKNTTNQIQSWIIDSEIKDDRYLLTSNNLYNYYLLSNYISLKTLQQVKNAAITYLSDPNHWKLHFYQTQVTFNNALKTVLDNMNIQQQFVIKDYTDKNDNITQTVITINTIQQIFFDSIYFIR